MVIWFDMDGTIADLYAVENWLPKLRASDPSPYEDAAVLLNMSQLARKLNKLQKAGYEIGIISWCAKYADDKYNHAVSEAKRDWLNKHLHSVSFDYINIVPYGCPKTDFMETDDDILFDDDESIRNAWTGTAYEPSFILSILSELSQ